MFFLYYEYFGLCFFINSLFQRPSKGVLMSLCRSFSNPPVAYLARDKCRCSIFATNNCRCRFFARIQMFAKRECCAIFFLCFPILNSTKSARKTVQTRERHSILWHQRITNDTKPNYPSLKPSFCPKWEVSVNVGLGEGEVGSFPET